MFAGMFDDHPEVVVLQNETAFFEYSYRYGSIKDEEQRFLRIFGQKWDGKQKFRSGRIDRHSNWRPLLYFRELAARRFDAEIILKKSIQTDSTRDTFLKIAKLYRETFCDARLDPSWCVEKTPGNERYGLWLHKNFPDARFIGVVRNPEDVIQSIFKKRRKLKHRIGMTALIYEILSWKVNFAVLSHLKRKLPDHVVILRYEDIVESPTKEMLQVADWLNISFRESLIVPTRFGAPLLSNSHFQDEIVQTGVASEEKVSLKDFSVMSEIQRSVISRLCVVENWELSYKKEYIPNIVVWLLLAPLNGSIRTLGFLISWIRKIKLD